MSFPWWKRVPPSAVSASAAPRMLVGFVLLAAFALPACSGSGGDRSSNSGSGGDNGSAGTGESGSSGIGGTSTGSGSGSSAGTGGAVRGTLCSSCTTDLDCDRTFTSCVITFSTAFCAPNCSGGSVCPSGTDCQWEPDSQNQEFEEELGLNWIVLVCVPLNLSCSGLGESCSSNGTVLNEYSSCHTPADCTCPLVCAGGSCLAACSSPDQCPGVSDICQVDAGYCSPDGGPSWSDLCLPCSTDSMCAPDNYCAIHFDLNADPGPSSYCAPDCSTTGICPGGTLCAPSSAATGATVTVCLPSFPGDCIH